MAFRPVGFAAFGLLASPALWLSGFALLGLSAGVLLAGGFPVLWLSGVLASSVGPWGHG